MATIEASIKITDKASPAINKMSKALDNAIEHCEKLEVASTDMINTNAIKSANDALDKTTKKFKQIQDNIDKAEKKQKGFLGLIKQTSNVASQLASKIGGFVSGFAGTVTAPIMKGIDMLKNGFASVTGSVGGFVKALAGIAVVKKSVDLMKKSIEAAAVQTNAELQLQVVLANGRASENAFDEITKKASEIQKRGIFGDEAMIAGAAEFGTYINDSQAIQTMMDSLANYAIGMSNGQEVSSQEMVNYATNLGKVMNGAYDAMSKKGFKFSEAQKAIIDGTATQAQYVQVLGKDYENMTEDMRKALAINSAIEESWGNLYDTMSNTPQGQITQLKNAWGDVTEEVGNRLAPSITAFFGTIKQNMPQIKTMTMGLANAFNFVLDILSSIMSVVGAIVSFIQQNWQVIGIALTTIIVLLTAVFFHVNSIILIAIAVIGFFNQIIAWINKATGASINAMGIIAGAVTFLGALIWDVIAFVWNLLIGIAEFVANFLVSPFDTIQYLMAKLLAFIFDGLADFADTSGEAAAKFANNMIKAINKVIDVWNSFVDIFGGLSSFFGIELKKGTKFEGEITNISFHDFANMANAYADKVKPFDFANKLKLGTVNLSNAYNNGYNWGAGFGNRAQQAMAKITAGSVISNSLDEIANNTGSTATNTGAINDTLSATDEDLKYLRELAERDVINRFTTAEIKVDMTNNNSISSDMDIDGVVRTLTQKLNEQLATQVEGVYA